MNLTTLGKQSRFNTQWFLPLLSGIFIGTSYIPFPPWASLFCFVPLWQFWQQQTCLKNVVIGGMMTSFVFTLIGFNWVTYLLHEFAHLPWPVAGVGMVIYALIAHLFVPIAGALWFLGQKRFNWPKTISLGLLALITTLSEAYSLTLFDWNFGYSWYGANLPIYQWAEFIGFSGLSALTLLSNLPLYIAWQQRGQHAGKWIATAVLIVFMGLNMSGLWLKQRLPQPDASFTTLLIQANTSNDEKMAAELGKNNQETLFKSYLKLTEHGLKNTQHTPIDFVVWPETAFPALLGEDFVNDPYPVALTQFLRDRHLPLITGAYSFEAKTRLITNSLFVLDQDGNITSPHYSKTILLAFGEYIPGEQWFPAIRTMLPATGHFARGAGPTALLQLKHYQFGGQICYEGLFPRFSKALADLGAQFIVNTTNDSWYGAWQEPYQHLYMTLARSVEFRRPVIRATNTGISTIALASGELLQQSPIQQAWTDSYKVPYLTQPIATFYQQCFWLVPILLWTTLITLLGIAFVQGMKDKNTKNNA